MKLDSPNVTVAHREFGFLKSSYESSH